MGIEPTALAWEARVLPLYDARSEPWTETRSPPEGDSSTSPSGLRLNGSTLALSPFLIVFAVFFWAFLWGIPGAFIGVPVTMAILTVCELDSSSRWIATLLSGPGRDGA